MIWIHFVWMCIFFNLQKYSDSCGQGLRSITNNWTGHASYYLLIISILSSGIHTLFPIGICFGIHLKMNNYKTKNYDAKSNISNSSPGNVGNCIIFRESDFKNFPGKHAPGPPALKLVPPAHSLHKQFWQRSRLFIAWNFPELTQVSLLAVYQNSTFVVQVHQLNLFIQYF